MFYTIIIILLTIVIPSHYRCWHYTVAVEHAFYIHGPDSYQTIKMHNQVYVVVNIIIKININFCLLTNYF